MRRMRRFMVFFLNCSIAKRAKSISVVEGYQPAGKICGSLTVFEVAYARRQTFVGRFENACAIHQVDFWIRGTVGAGLCRKVECLFRYFERACIQRDT